MKLYAGTIPTMHNTPCKIAVFPNGKVFQKEFFRNTLYRQNWKRNIILEKINSIKLIEEKLFSLGFTAI